MEVREMEKKEPPVVPWIPSTPVKPVPVKPVPIYPAGEGSHVGHVNGAVACTEFSISQKTYGGSEHLRYSENPMGHGNEAVACTGFSVGQKTHGGSEHLGYSERHMGHVNGAVACSEFSVGQKTHGESDHLGYSELLFRVMKAEPANSNVAQQENNDGSMNPFVSTISGDNFRNRQEISYIAWSSKETSQDTPFTADNANESSHMVAVQINVEGKDPGGEEKNAADKLDNNTQPINKEFCDSLTEFAALSSPFKENHNLYVGSSHDTDLNKTPQQKPRRRKHRPKVIKEDKPKTSRKPATPKPVQSKENPTGKRKYVRRKGLSAASAPPTEVSGELTQEIPSSAEKSCKRSLNFDMETKDENSAERENMTALCKGNAVETDVGLSCGMHISVKQASTSHLSLLEETQTPNTSPSTRKSSGTKSKETPTVKRKYVRRKGVNKTSPTEMTGEQTKESMPESAQMSCTGSVNFEGRARDRSSTVEENVTAHPSNEIGVVMQEMKQVPNGPSSKTNLPGAKAQDNPTVKRKYVRRKGVNKTSPTEMTRELTKEKRERGLNMSPFPWTEMTGLAEAMITESNSMPWGRSLDLEIGTRDGSCAGSEKVALEETTASLAYRDTWMKLALNDMPLPEDSTGNLLGAKLNANSVVNKNKRKGQIATQDGNISNSQISMARLQTSGSKRKPSGTVDCADDSPMNMYGAHYNALSAYQANFWVPFPNLQKKRRTEKGKASNTYVTSSMTTTEDQPTDPQAHLHASSSNCWNYGAGYNEARIPATSESTNIDDPQAFEKFISHVRKLAERSQSPTQIIHFGSQTRIRNNTETNHTSKQLAISGKPNLGDAERPRACIDAFVAETCAPLTKKKRNTKKGALSRSACSQTNKMQPIGVSSEVIRKTMEDYVNALAEQFRQININTNARDLALHEPNAIVPYGLQDQNGAIIPYEPPKKPVKKQRPRPKVNVDDETERVWKLLMLDINSHGVDGTDEAKAKWWEEERNVFHGRADSFIARMHLVQGDRRFSRWKGSVVDSVVGVFLTQNVSDHLSSSAFMALAARFPKKSNCESKTYCAEDMRLVTTKPQVQIVEPEENTESDLKSLNQSVYDQSSMTVDIVDHSGEKEAVNSNDSCGTTSSVISLTDESNSRLTETSQRNIKDHCSQLRSELSAAIDEGEEKSCYIGDGKGLNDTVSSQCSVISSQISGDFSNDQNPEKIGSSCSDSNSEAEDLSSTAKYNHFDCSTSFCKLLEMVSSPSVFLKNQDENGMNKPIFQSTEPAEQVATTHSQSIVSQVHPQEQSKHMQPSFFNHSGQNQDILEKEKVLDLNDHNNHVRNDNNEISSAPIELKNKGQENKKKDDFKWDSLRIKAQAMAGKREKTENTMDSMDWEAVRRADVNDIANTIRERGMNNRLADRIQDFLNRMVEDHGSIDLEWLRDVPPDKAKEYLLSIRGLGLKSVECVRLLTLHHLAFPVDTNVGRIAVRLGWVPLQPLPESLQLHLLELYPVLESIQKYLWPRLCKLDQKTLYELHYQMITFGKVFCTKNSPNCNACPMRGECRHFASAFASARLALPGPEQKSIVSKAGNSEPDQHPPEITNQLHLPPPESTSQADKIQLTDVSGQLESKSEINICQPIIEEPTTPEQECLQILEMDMEDAFNEDSCEIPTIKLNMEEFTHNLQTYMQNNMEVQEGEMSKALVALNPQVASIPMPKLKNVSRLRTEHWVYELPDTHPLLEGWVAREPDDPGKYLLAIWTPGETANSIQPPKRKCSSQEKCGQLCNEKECFSCNSFREANSQIVRGTILIPCRTAMRGRFPLNGTYFQVNEVFADQDSSINPISVPRSWIWNLNRRTVYFGTSIPTIFKGLSTQEIQQCFWRGYVCVRGFDRKTRAPRPLMARLHIPASKSAKKKEQTKKKSGSANSRGSKRKPKQQELISSSSNLQKPKQQELISSSSNLQGTGRP